jgi:cyclohexyl-isocyanide hydratase
MRAGLLLFPRMTQLDLTGPYEILSRVPGLSILLLWKTRQAVTSDTGLSMLPTATFDKCPQLDLILVPGGPGQLPLMEDEEVLSFLRRQAAEAKYITSVCTGSLVLGAAGLLRGYRATSHWLYRDLLAEFGAEVVPERYVIDGNRITGAGVTAGIDFGLKLAAVLCGEEEAKCIQLSLEYDPAPPFGAGSPQAAGQKISESVRLRGSRLREQRIAAIQRLKNPQRAALPSERQV